MKVLFQQSAPDLTAHVDLPKGEDSIGRITRIIIETDEGSVFQLEGIQTVKIVANVGWMLQGVMPLWRVLWDKWFPKH